MIGQLSRRINNNFNIIKLINSRFFFIQKKAPFQKGAFFI